MLEAMTFGLAVATERLMVSINFRSCKDMFGISSVKLDVAEVRKHFERGCCLMLPAHPFAVVIGAGRT